ncbi:MAG: hypothetical protein HXS46_00510 [Theionarchaea archaeon]|nr:hypothetical protein [Theionarchaea archaeon]
MKAFLTKRRAVTLAVLLAAAVTFFFLGMRVESTCSGTWVSPCKVDYALNPFEIVQAGDVLYLSYERDFTIHLYSSSDGCNWSKVDVIFFEEGEHVWRSSACLFTTPDDELGMAWVEKESDTKKKPRSTIFWSRFDGSTWSEPELVLQRDEPCRLVDAIVLENGALLLLWNEFLVYQVKNGDRTFDASGCDVIYRAYVSSEELLVERVIEPEDPRFCSSEGYSFVNDGHHIWCVFEHGPYGEPNKIYRSKSEDGRMWSPPEPIHLPPSVSSEVFLTPQGEIGIIDFEVGQQNLFLFKSSDWEKWSREKLFRTEEGIKGAVIAKGKNGTMWGFVYTRGREENLFFIHSAQESVPEYENKMVVIKILEGLSLSCIVLIVVLIVSWALKLKREQILSGNSNES